MISVVNKDVPRWRSITTRQAVVTFVIALTLSIVAGLIELAEDARVLREETREQTLRLISLVEGSAAEAAFQLNPDLANQVASGLYGGGNIRYLALKDDFGRIMVEQGTLEAEPASGLLQRLFGDITDYHQPLLYNPGAGGEPQQVGEIIITLSIASIGQSYIERSLLVFVLGMIKAMGIALLVVLAFHFFITRPLLRVYNAIAEVNPRQPGDWEKPEFPIHRNDELGRLVSGLDNLMQAFQQGLDQRDELHQISTLDGLTGIPNRRRFDEFMEHQWQHAQRTREPLAVIFIDIDYFKPYNDNYGHATGDDTLRAVARSLADAMPRATDLVARYGGEEFVCVLPHTDSDGALEVAEKLRQRIQALNIPHAFSRVASQITISMGVASTTPGRHDNLAAVSDLLCLADSRLYLAKEQGRNRAVASDRSPEHAD
ncbi:GGDEF domain-containing protein [Halopseudomonas salegens]|uniref:diguanylate cyclase n=1 Tax=Halopseudomonas salegens TaxID=1434072 RepID=A0A1H2FCA6_9GAMM|nr:diguanylate cyclase [Halopseudomonas salegens]SDU04974.1 diguanylate cyclase (GGDEF) domain-containing protein [Halopseudomonas salegens]